MALMKRQSLVKFDAPLCETIVDTPKPAARPGAAESGIDRMQADKAANPSAASAASSACRVGKCR